MRVILQRILCLAAISLLVPAASCKSTGGSAGSLRTVSHGSTPAVLPGNFVAAVYSHDPNRDTTFMLADVPVAAVLEGKLRQGQILHVDLLWVPKPGATPIDADATNATIRYVIVSDGEVGIYGGAGFAMPRGRLGQRSLSISLRDASLQLLESTPNFVDRLGPAQMTGSFTAKLDDKKTRELHFAASQLVTNALGRTRYVLK